MKKNTFFSCFAAGALFLSSCAVNPVTGKKQVVLMSEAQEIAMGKDADPQIIAQYGLYESPELQAFINAEGKKMAAISHRPNLEYNFRIVDSDILNAFAIPGGYVYFTRGIMANFNNEAEFAGVLGHEIGHITARHSVVQQRNAILSQIGLITTMVLAPNLAQFADQASQGLGLLFLKFGRDAEREADQLGTEYSSKIGFDAEQMAEFFTTLERQAAESGNAGLPDFLSTHPNPGDRHIAVSKAAAEWKKKLNLTNAQINRNSYLKKIDGIIYGEDPKQGFVENNIFYHPVLKFQFPIPTSWSYQNTPQRFQMAPKDGKAMMMLTLAPGKTLQESASAVLQQYNLQALESKQTTVNGLNAIAMVADLKPDPNQQQQQQSQEVVRTLSYIIQYGDLNYLMIGVTGSNSFNNYVPLFTSSMQNFRVLTDAAKLNKKPERIRLKTVSSTQTLQQVLKANNTTDKRLNELAILNGMKLTDKVAPGTLIKIVSE
ncbi:MAG: M48 family metalloprotease [Daejeonella sp.]